LSILVSCLAKQLPECKQNIPFKVQIKQIINSHENGLSSETLPSFKTLVVTVKKVYPAKKYLTVFKPKFTPG
jgi:hypothetical protein